MSFNRASSAFGDRTPGEDGEIVTRTFNIHRFDPHPRRKILIVNGEVMVTVSSAVCPVILAEESREFKKLISLDNLSQESDRELVVENILKECPFIDSELRLHLAVVVDFIRNRKYDENGLLVTPSNSFAESAAQNKSDAAASTPTEFQDYVLETETLTATSLQANETELNEKVDMISIDHYVELLYEEDFSEKIRGARCIGKLAKVSENLSVIAYHETAVNALTRTLREEYKKSMELSTHIMSTCLSYAKFTDFHPLLLTNKICSITFDIIEFELERYERWRLELARRQDIVENRSEFPGSAGSYQKAKNEFEKLRVKFAEITRKQDNLLALSFEVILYLSENPQLQPEIISRGIVQMLMDSIARKNIDLLKIVLKFLRNLAIFVSCKSQMAQGYVVEKLAQLLDANIPNEITKCCLELCFNLSFDTKLRHKMVLLGIFHKLPTYLEDSSLERVAKRLTYVMSMDRKVRPKFAQILSILPKLMERLGENQDEPGRNSLHIAGILINLALNRKCAAAMCEENRLVTLLQQAFESEDEIVMKIVRNISDHPNTKEHFAPYLCDLARAVKDATSIEFVLECIGTLGNLDLPNVDFCRLLQEFELVSMMTEAFDKHLNQAQKPSYSDSTRDQGPNSYQIALELVILAGTCCGDAECAEMLIQHEGMLDSLVKMLLATGHHSDMDMKCQLLFVFYRMCQHPGPRQHIQQTTLIPKLVLELLQSENEAIEQLCEAIITLFGQTDQSWVQRLRERRFRYCNQAWIEMTEKTHGQLDIDDPSSYTYPHDDNFTGSVAFRSSKEKVLTIDLHPSSSSELLGTDDDQDSVGEEQSDLETDKELDLDLETSHFGENDEKSIFDKFKAQYEHEMRVKEQQGGTISDEDDNPVLLRKVKGKQKTKTVQY